MFAATRFIKNAVMRSPLVLFPVCILLSCTSDTVGQHSDNVSLRSLIVPNGSVVAERIQPSPGFRRVNLPPHSFGHFLRMQPLLPHGSKVHYYDGRQKLVDVHVAVLSTDVGSRDLQQCADAVIRLRAEYLFTKGQQQSIHFNLTNGFRADYTKWREGNRLKIIGNNTSWVRSRARDTSYRSFRQYLNMIFSYAGTLSLSRELKPVQFSAIQPGDVLIQGGSPGHAVIVVDVAVNQKGEKIFLLAQSYMPAQQIHILKNPSERTISPWYYTPDIMANVHTPEWTFTTKDLKRFEE